MPIGEGELGWTLGVGGRRVAVCDKPPKNKNDDDDGRFVGGTIDYFDLRLNGADLVVKSRARAIVVVVCRLYFKEKLQPVPKYQTENVV